MTDQSQVWLASPLVYLRLGVAVCAVVAGIAAVALRLRRGSKQVVELAIPRGDERAAVTALAHLQRHLGSVAEGFDQLYRAFLVGREPMPIPTTGSSTLAWLV